MARCVVILYKVYLMQIRVGYYSVVEKGSYNGRQVSRQFWNIVVDRQHLEADLLKNLLGSYSVYSAFTMV